MTIPTQLGLGRQVDLTIDDIGYGGDGLARIDGKIVFVPGTLIGERVRAQIVSEKSDFARARALEIQTPSASRVQPRCRHFGACGGCQLQHLNYSEQVLIKFNQANQSLSRLQGEMIRWQQPVAAEPAWNYRQRIQLHRSNASGTTWGFYKEHSHEVVVLEECPITRPEIMAALPELLSHQTADKVDIVVAPGQKPVAFSAQADSRTSVVWERTVAGKKMRTTGAGFIQIHAEQNEALVGKVIDMARRCDAYLKQHLLWDLYAGNGNFSIPLADHARQIISVEENPLAHADAVHNARINNASNVECIKGDVAAVWSNLAAAGEPDVILIDPPRAGAKALLPLLARFKRKPLLMYVACELPALRRDVRELLQGGYRMVEGVVLDLFPQTAHFETVVALRPL